MKGTYCLLLKLKKSKIKIGSLGLINFEKGYYIYIGSALNNFEKRIQRHLKKSKKKHWHIDYLTTNKNIKIEKVFCKKSEKREECKVAKKIKKIGKPINNFGCSDCKCKSHLFKINKPTKILNFKEISFRKTFKNKK